MQNKATQQRESVVVRFAGDSGDGMQLTGGQFTMASVLAGNDVATFPDYPAEIRAPAGTLAGVSGFQLHFSANEIFTPGDTVDVLVAMNPAALAKNLGSLREGGALIVNESAFSKKGLKLAGYEDNPLEDDSLADYQTYLVDLSRLTHDALKDSGLSAKEVERCKNFFALGLMCWLYERPRDAIVDEVTARFGGKPKYLDANLSVFKAGFDYGENSEQFLIKYAVPAVPADKVAAGKYRNITGNEALAIGLAVGAAKSGKPMFYGSYPITPASDILHYLSNMKHLGVRTFQAEDEIAAICATLGAAYGNSVAVTGTSGPGLALKGEALGLAVMTELPMVVVNVQRGGPSTGLPTKTEQADLLQAVFGRNGESPCAVLSARSPGDAFYVGFEAVRIALRHMLPVVVLTDGFIANGAEPWKIPDVNELPEITSTELNSAEGLGEDGFQPYDRDPSTLARPWPTLGTPGLEHRLGGLEKWDKTGHISYDPDNHHDMTLLRQSKVDRIAESLPPIKVIGEKKGDVLVVSWGSTYGTCLTAVRQLQREGKQVSMISLRWLNPLPSDLGALLNSFTTVLVPEINNGQLLKLLRMQHDFNGVGYNRVAGQPLQLNAVKDAIIDCLAS